MKRERGLVLIAVMLALVLVAAISLLLSTESAMEGELTSRGTEAMQADYLAQASLQHAIWQNDTNVCRGDFNVPATLLGTHSYAATVTGGGATTAYSLSADQDAWIRNDNPTGNNGSTVDQHIRFQSGNVEHALYRFDLSSLPTGAQINSASASFFIEATRGHPEGPVTVHRVNADWTESGATWDNMNGNFDSQVLAMIPPQADSGGVEVQVNLTAQVQAWVNGEPNYGVLLASASEGVHAEYVSREGASNQQPRLDVVVGTAPASPVNIQATGTLANGVTRTLSRPVTQAVQFPNTLELQPDGAAGTDAYIWQWYPTTNFGNDDEAWVSRAGTSNSRSLFTFNLAGVPAGSKILNATLSLHHESGNNPDVPITAHRISNPWNEAFVTWNRRDNGINWDTTGGDFDAAVVATTDVGPASNTRYEWDIASLVQDWIDGAPNYGVALATARANSVGERFYTSDETIPTRRPRLTIEYACECGSACMAPQGAGNVLMVVVNPTTLVPADATKKALFESWGYTVNVISESANATTYASEAANNDVVFISETVNSGQVGTKLVDLSIGVVSQDGDYNSDLGFASGSSWTVSPELTVTNSSHYITQVFPSGPLDIYSGSMEQLTVSGSQAPGLTTLAETGGAGSLAALDQGAMMSNGSNAPGRRVMLPFGREANLSWQYLNGNGLVMLQRAIAWAMNADSGSSGNLLMVVGNAGSPSSGDLDRQSLMESWGYAVTLIDDGDSQANFDAALAVNDVAFVTEEADPGAIGSKLTGTTVGIVNEEKMLLIELGFSGEFDSNSRSDVVILDNTHSITSGLALGTTTITTSNQPLTFTNNGPASGAQILAETNQVSSFFEPSLLTLETNAELWGGGFAAGRRVSLPWGDIGFDINALNTDGLMIMQRAIEWAAGVGDGGTGFDVLMVAADPTNLTQAAADRRALMESWGYTVTLIDDDETTVNLVNAVDAADVVYIGSGSTATDNVSKIVTNTAKGIVNEPAVMASVMGLASSLTAAFGVDQLTIVDGTHSITQGLPDPVTVFNALGVPAVLTGTLSPDLQNLAAALGAPAVAVLESGASRHDAGTSPGRRAQLPFAGAVGADLTADGQLIVRRAIEWAATAPGPAYNVLLIVGNATTLGTKDAGYKALIESWGHTVAVLDDDASQAAYDAAMDAADAIYATGSASGPSMLDKPTYTTKGMVNEVNGKIDNFGFSSSTSATANFDTFSTTDAAHYITEPFSGNAVTVFTASLTNPVPGGTLAPDLQNVAADGGTLVLGTLDTGATRYDGNPSPGRRAHLPFTAAETTDMTADGQLILQRTLEWAAGAGGGGGGGGGDPDGGGGGIVFEESTEGRNQIGVAAGFTIPTPSGTASGDLLVVAVATDGNTVSTLSPNPAWNLTQLDVFDSSGAVTFGVWWKIADGTESMCFAPPCYLTVDWTGGAQGYGWIMRFTGHDPSSPIATASMNSGTNRNPQSNNLITSSDGNLILRLGGFDDDDITLDDPGLSGHTVITMDRSNTGNLNTVSGGAGYVIQATAGNTGTSNFALTAREQYRSVTIAIRPAQ